MARRGSDRRHPRRHRLDTGTTRKHPLPTRSHRLAKPPNRRPTRPRQTEARRILAATPSPLLTAAAAQAETDDWPTFSQAIKAATGLTGKALYLPLRAALTGRTDGPNLPEIYTRIGKTRRQNRLRQAAQAPSPSQ